MAKRTHVFPLRNCWNTKSSQLLAVTHKYRGRMWTSSNDSEAKFPQKWSRQVKKLLG